MIAAWMIFATEIGALLFAAAWIADYALRAARRPLRGVWFAAIVGTNLLPILILNVPLNQSFTEKWALSVSSGSLLSRIGTPLFIGWMIAIAVGVLVCSTAIWRMSRTRPQWKTEHVDNTPVLVSHDIGPALVGVMHYSIVVPCWAYTLEERARGLLLAHEREHARHYDPLLLASAVLAVVVAPWNVFNWILFKRLHLAVELDCDQRVLRAHPDARGYGELLLDVAERVLPSVMPAAAFVEHGASLETRLDAMTEKPKRHQSIRLSAGLGAAALLAAAACVVPRPIVIVVQPVVGATGQPVEVVEPKANPKQSVVERKQGANTDQSPIQSSPERITRSSASAANARMTVDPSTLPIAPSAQTLALDAEEADLIRTSVLAVAPRTLENWPRSDSALVLLFNARGEVVKRTSISTARLSPDMSARNVFTQLFTIPEISELEFASEIHINRGVHFDVLGVPLRPFAGRMMKGATISLTREEVIPSHRAMVSTLRAKYPELLTDTTSNPMVGGLLFGSRGELLASAAIRMNIAADRADGSSSAVFDSVFMRMAFGNMLDSGVIVQSGRTSYFDETTPRDGRPRLIYAVLVKRSQFAGMSHVQDLPDLRFSGMSSRYATPLPDQNAMNKRLLSLVQSRVPDAFGAWSRADSCVVLLFDEDDQLIARRAGPIPQSAQLMELADLLSSRVGGLQASEVGTVGQSAFTISPSGREIRPALRVVWGRLQNSSSVKRK